MESASIRKKKKGGWIDYVKKHYPLYLMLAAPILFYIIFCYMPMGGLVIAFKDYSLRKGIWGSEWCGFEIFERLFHTAKFWRAFKNTIVLNVWSLIVGFPAPIILALLMNEVRNAKLKKGLQTIVYLPHFLSWVIIGGMAVQIFATNGGVINVLLNQIGLDSIPFLSDNTAWIGTYVGIGVWQSIGWGAIIYISAISGVDQEQYEAARVDGCSRFKMTYKITLPNIMPTIIIMLILKIGGMVSIGFEPPLMLGNSMVSEVSEVLSTYAYQTGMVNGNFSLGTAIGLFQSILNFGLVMSSNWLCRKITGEAIW